MLRTRTAKARVAIPHTPCELLLLKKNSCIKNTAISSIMRASLVGLGKALVTHALVACGAFVINLWRLFPALPLGQGVVSLLVAQLAVTIGLAVVPHKLMKFRGLNLFRWRLRRLELASFRVVCPPHLLLAAGAALHLRGEPEQRVLRDVLEERDLPQQRLHVQTTAPSDSEGLCEGAQGVRSRRAA